MLSSFINFVDNSRVLYLCILFLHVEYHSSRSETVRIVIWSRGEDSPNGNGLMTRISYAYAMLSFTKRSNHHKDNNIDPYCEQR